MYESLVIGRSFMIGSCSSYRTPFCRPCLQSRGAWTILFSKAKLQHVLRGSTIRLIHLGIYKGGSHSDILTGTQGEYGQWDVYQSK